MQYTVTCGADILMFNLPSGMRGTLLENKKLPSPQNPALLIKEALDRPLDSASLVDLVAKTRAKRICIAFTDTSRACPDHLLVPPMLAQLEANRVSPEKITLVCAVGLHRPVTEMELRNKLGNMIADRYRVVIHNARDVRGLSNIGHTLYGIPVSANRQVAEADLLIATGVVEPHNFAGYSGGSKTVVIGCGGEETISGTHSPAMLDRPGVRLGSIENNPFQKVIRAAGKMIGLNFVLNVVLDGDRRILAAAAGDATAVHEHLVAFARQVYEAPITRQFDVAIAGVSSPKDTNIYQATRAATYLYFAPVPVVRPGGIIIIPARCPEGAGKGPGEQRFYQALRQADDISSLVTTLRQCGYAPGAQRAYMVAQAMTSVEFVVVGSLHPEIIRECKMTPIDSIEDALTYARNKLGQNLEVAIIPHALQTLPILKK